MKFSRESAEFFVPDGLAPAEALARCTDLVVAAHQDDVEIMAFRPILDCFQNESRWLAAVIVTGSEGHCGASVSSAMTTWPDQMPPSDQ